MFILSRLSDLIRIPPDQFNKEPKKALLNELHKKYANKVIQNLGLIISVWDLIKVDDGLLKPGDGASYIKCVVRVVVFRPFIGEVLTGWIQECTPEGIKVKMGFFDEIFIPKNMIFEDSVFSINESAWIWNQDADSKLYLDVNEKIRFTVEQEIFVNIKPKGPTAIDGTIITNGEDDDNNEEDENDNNKPKNYALLGSCQTDGMGLVSWWD